MSTGTPIADAIHARTKGGVHEENYIDALGSVRELERENAKLRDEVEMLNVRHAAAMLHAQTHADEYNALREELSLANGTIESRDRNIATLREELAEARSAAEKWMSQCAEWRDANVKLGEDMAVAKREIEQRGELANRHAKAYADAQARALEYKTEHAALLGTSQWQEVEIADLRDDVKRLHKTVSECEERALAAEKERDAIAGLNQDQFLQLEYLRPVFEAAHALYIESEEYDFDDGLGRGAQQQFWDALASNFEPATEAIDAAVEGANFDTAIDSALKASAQDGQ